MIDSCAQFFVSTSGTQYPRDSRYTAYGVRYTIHDRQHPVHGTRLVVHGTKTEHGEWCAAYTARQRGSSCTRALAESPTHPCIWPSTAQNVTCSRVSEFPVHSSINPPSIYVNIDTFGFGRSVRWSAGRSHPAAATVVHCLSFPRRSADTAVIVFFWFLLHEVWLTPSLSSVARFLPPPPLPFFLRLVCSNAPLTIEIGQSIKHF